VFSSSTEGAERQVIKFSGLARETAAARLRATWRGANLAPAIQLLSPKSNIAQATIILASDEVSGRREFFLGAELAEARVNDG